jgi:hypothetical protein
MSDFIREVDEEYRQDQFRNFLNRHWVSLLLVVAVVLAGAGAWRGYGYWRQQQAEAAGARYFDALDLQAANPSGSVAALDALAKNGPAGYRVLARLRAAGDLGSTDAAAGVTAFDAVAADASIDPDLRDVAALRAGILSVDTAEPAELRRRLEPLADANSSYRGIAREMLAVAALKRGDDADAGKWLDAIVADPIASADTRQRAGFYLSLLRAGRPIASPAPAAPEPATAGQPGAGAPATTP